MIQITPKEFNLLASLIEREFGIHLKPEKATLLTGRLHKVLDELGFTTFTQYYDYLLKDKSSTALATLVDKITTNHTYFMREAEHFDYFYHTVLPQVKALASDKDLRIWCAASSSGEEPYTLAMLIDDFFEGEKQVWDLKILATDISEPILETAIAGIYHAEALAALPKHWQVKHFKRLPDGRFAISEAIKSQVIFRKFNLMEDVYPWRKKLHVVFCRNVMIYFDAPIKDKVVQRIYNCLHDGGYLFVGHSESVNRNVIPLHYVKPAVYRKGAEHGSQNSRAGIR